jgi:hypothetical protein
MRMDIGDVVGGDHLSVVAASQPIAASFLSFGTIESGGGAAIRLAPATTIQVARDGLYLIVFHVEINMSGGGYGYQDIYLNGALYERGSTGRVDIATILESYYSRLKRLKAGDRLQTMPAYNVGGPLNCSGNAQVVRLG